MIVPIEASIEPVRNGVQARGAAIGLVGQGTDEAAALRSLQRAALGWCLGLARAGALESVLTRRGIAWEANGSGVEVIVHRTKDEMGS